MTSLPARASTPPVAGCLEMVDRSGSELDRERDRPRLRELVTVEPEREPGLGAGEQVAPRLIHIESAALEEHVGRLRNARSAGQDVGQREGEVGVGAVELRRHRVRAEPCRYAACVPHCPQAGKLGLTVEAVARLRLERRRPLRAHPGAVTLHSGPQAGLVERSRRSDRRQDAAARRMQLLVARASGAESELLDPVAAEAGVGVAVDQPGQRAAAPSVDLDEVALEWLQVAHAADGRDRVAVDEHVRLLQQLDLSERASAQWRCPAGRADELREIADEQPRHAALRDRPGAQREPPSAGTGREGAETLARRPDAATGTALVHSSRRLWVMSEPGARSTALAWSFGWPTTHAKPTPCSRAVSIASS